VNTVKNKMRTIFTIFILLYLVYYNIYLFLHRDTFFSDRTKRVSVIKSGLYL